MFGRINQRVIQQGPSSENVQIPVQNLRQSPFMPLKFSNTLQIPINNIIPAIPPDSSIKIDLLNVNAIKSSNTMKWGKPTWFLFHTLAEKVSESQFHTIRKELLDIIYSICTNLPCPDCANHARTYLDGINFNTIQTKQDLKMMLFIFHNTVNKRKGYEVFRYEELDEKYSLAITVNIIQNFMSYYLIKNPAPQMIANDMFRRRIITNVQQWLKTNSSLFS